MATNTVKSPAFLPQMENCSAEGQATVLNFSKHHQESMGLSGQPATKESVASLVELLREVYQDHLLYDLFQSQDSEEAKSIEAICSRVADVLQVYGSYAQICQHG